jgi:hypothetical protein
MHVLLMAEMWNLLNKQGLVDCQFHALFEGLERMFLIFLDKQIGKTGDPHYHSVLRPFMRPAFSAKPLLGA